MATLVNLIIFIKVVIIILFKVIILIKVSIIKSIINQLIITLNTIKLHLVIILLFFLLFVSKWHFLKPSKLRYHFPLNLFLKQFFKNPNFYLYVLVFIIQPILHIDLLTIPIYFKPYHLPLLLFLSFLLLYFLL